MAYDLPAKRGPRKPPARSTFVYFIQADTLGLIKIGCAVDPWDRLYTLQIGSPDSLTLRAVIEDAEAFGHERKLHRKFASHRRHGEWFEPHPDLIDYIEKNGRDYDELISEGQAELANRILCGG